jgi:hypothetical protein
MGNGHVVFVLGAPRSGTSALTRVLSLSGCVLPKTLFAARAANPTGFWEPIEATKLNTEFLYRHGSMLGDLSMRMLETRISAEEREAFVRKLQAFLSECPSGDVLVVKELRIAPLLEFWLEAARRNSLSTRVVVLIRHPREVVASVITQNRALSEQDPLATGLRDLSLEAATARWLMINLLAERQSRSLPRVFVNYWNLLKEPARQVARVSNTLGLDLEADAPSVSRFLSKDLHTHRCSGPVTEIFAYSWVSRVYKILVAAAEDAPMDLSSMDDIYNGFRLNEHTFRIAEDESRTRFALIQALQFQAVENAPIWTLGKDF